MTFDDVEHVEVAGVVAEDYPDFCDAFFRRQCAKRQENI